MSTATRTAPSSLDRALAAGNWPVLRPDGVWLVESTSIPGLDRQVRIDASTGAMSCTCDAARHDSPDCKHRAAVRYCLANGIRGRLYLCGRCASIRVRKPGLCADCILVVAEQAAPRRSARPKRSTVLGTICPRCDHEVDPLHDAFCS